MGFTFYLDYYTCPPLYRIMRYVAMKTLIITALLAATLYNPLPDAQRWLKNNSITWEDMECVKRPESKNTYLCRVWLDMKQDPAFILKCTPGVCVRRVRSYRVRFLISP